MQKMESLETQQADLIISAEDFAEELKPTKTLRQIYLNNPPDLAVAKFNLKFPHKLKAYFMYIWNKALRHEDVYIAIKSPRGGGKSQWVSVMEFALWYMLDAEIISMGGSEKQAKEVFGYADGYIDTDQEFKDATRNRLMERIDKHGDGRRSPYISCIPASMKQVRGPHPGGKDRYGVLVIDEVMEADDDIVLSAFPQLTSADYVICILLTTYHKSTGVFADIWEDATVKDAGGTSVPSFIKLDWDIFDVCETCTDDCATCIGGLRDKYCGWHCDCVVAPYGIKKEYRAGEIKVEGLKCSVCGGTIRRKARDGGGWIKINRIRWYYLNYPESKFEIEIMGWKAGKELFVVNQDCLRDRCLVPRDIIKFEKPTVENPRRVKLTVDWGYVTQTAVHAVQFNGVMANHLSEKYFTRELDDPIFAYINGEYVKYKSQGCEVEVCADSSHPFQNNKLRDGYRLQLKEIDFQMMKITLADALANRIEKGLVNIEAGSILGEALKKWRKDPLGKIKKNPKDHPCDSFICAFCDDVAALREPGTSETIDEPNPKVGSAEQWMGDFYDTSGY